MIGGFGGCVSLLAAAGADLNVLDESDGNTVLMELARKGQTRMCRRLLEVGADHTVKDEDGTVHKTGNPYRKRTKQDL